MQKEFGNDNKALNNVSVCMHELEAPPTFLD